MKTAILCPVMLAGVALTLHPHCTDVSPVQFGNSFLNKLEGSVVDAPNLRYLTLVDTPGEQKTAPQPG